jgi:hypothetical protein
MDPRVSSPLSGLRFVLAINVIMGGLPLLDESFIREVVSEVVSTQQAWISMTRLGGNPVIRACITNYRSQEEDVIELIKLLNAARAKARRT